MHPWLLHHLLDRSAAQHPQAPAVIHGARILDYASLADQAGRLAAALADLGVQPGDRVGILTGKSLEGVIAIFGVLKAGGVYVPLDPQAPPRRQGQILDRCAIRVLIADARLAAALFADAQALAGVQALVLVGDADHGSALRILHAGRRSTAIRKPPRYLWRIPGPPTSSIPPDRRGCRRG